MASVLVITESDIRLLRTKTSHKSIETDADGRAFRVDVPN